MDKNKFRTSNRDAELQREIDELAAANAPKTVEADPAPKDVEDATWKKRYSDLRSHTQKIQDETNRKLAELERQLSAQTQKEVKFPKTEEEINEWASKYPDIAKIVDTIAMKRSREAAEALDARVNEINEREHQSTRRTAYLKLIEAHPDFEELLQEQNFHDWVSGQPQYIYDALHVNETDAFAAIRAIDLYKADTQKNKKTPPAKPDTSAAETVRQAGRQSPTGESGAKWSETKMSKLSGRDLEKFMPEIDEAIRSGNFEYDLSGGAR